MAELADWIAAHRSEMNRITQLVRIATDEATGSTPPRSNAPGGTERYHAQQDIPTLQRAIAFAIHATRDDDDDEGLVWCLDHRRIEDQEICHGLHVTDVITRHRTQTCTERLL